MKTYSITTFGCQMNVSDSERVAAVCESMGYTPANEDQIADLYVINSCSIRQKAEDRVLGMGKKFFKFKSENSNIKTVLTGCMAKRDIRQGQGKSKDYQLKYEGKLQKQMPWLDIVLEISDIHKLPEVLGEKVEVKNDEYFAVQPKYNSKFQAFVPISTGCNKFCTFCIVPFTRGQEVYRPYEQIYKEVEALVKAGFKEITLLGQNVNSWKSEIKGDLIVPVPKFRKTQIDEKREQGNFMDFADLMESLADIEGDFWLRFTSSHPYDINPRLIEVVAAKPKIAKQFHFALQAGSNSVLKRMNRHYTVEEFKEKVYEIKRQIPDVAVTTDVIVGFCGETEKEFQETLETCKELQFDQIFISEYSQRAGTIADKFYKDDISREVKTERKERLDQVLKQGLEENNKKLIGTKQKVLIFRDKLKNREGVFGRTTHGKDVLIKFKSDSVIPVSEAKRKNTGISLNSRRQSPTKLQRSGVGEFVEVEIVGSKLFKLEARVI
jgi:tRNA-2-methylthio-N6-dimethylallyladenosine synthase